MHAGSSEWKAKVFEHLWYPWPMFHYVLKQNRIHFLEYPMACLKSGIHDPINHVLDVEENGSFWTPESTPNLRRNLQGDIEVVPFQQDGQLDNSEFIITSCVRVHTPKRLPFSAKAKIT